MTILKVGNKEYQLIYNFSALKYIESKGINLQKLENVYMDDISILVHAGLRKMYKDLTIDDTDLIIDALSEEIGLEQAFIHLSKLIQQGLSSGKKQ